MKNNSGIYPSGNRVLVKPDSLKDTKKTLIKIPDEVLEKYQMAACFGYVVALGPDCFLHTVSVKERLIDKKWAIVERVRTGYVEPFASVGDRVAFATYAGKTMDGVDNEEYKMMNDTDIMGTVDEGVTQTSLEARKPLGAG